MLSCEGITCIDFPDLYRACIQILWMKAVNLIIINLIICDWQLVNYDIRLSCWEFCWMGAVYFDPIICTLLTLMLLTMSFKTVFYVKCNIIHILKKFAWTIHYLYYFKLNGHLEISCFYFVIHLFILLFINKFAWWN